MKHSDTCCAPKQCLPVSSELATSSVPSPTYRSTIPDPSCTALIDVAQECCRDASGGVWPPLPATSSDAASSDAETFGLPELTALLPEDVPALRAAHLGRGNALRQGVPVPLRKEWAPRVAVCALQVGGTTQAGLREWTKHHRCGPWLKAFDALSCIQSISFLQAPTLACGCVIPCRINTSDLRIRLTQCRCCRFIGVDRLVIYRTVGSWDASPRSNTATVLHRKLSASESDSSSAASYAVRQKCLDEHRKEYAFVGFLTSLEYLVVRGQGSKQVQGSLRSALRKRDMRYAPGALQLLLLWLTP